MTTEVDFATKGQIIAVALSEDGCELITNGGVQAQDLGLSHVQPEYISQVEAIFGLVTRRRNCFGVLKKAARSK